MVTQESIKSSRLDLSSLMKMESVAFLEATSRDEAIKELIQRLSQDHNLVNEEEFLNAIMQREKIASTGIGVGVAVPHAKLPIYDDFFIAVGILKQGIDWGAMDELPVKLIFLIGGPDDKQTQYLNLLSQLTLYLRDEEVRKKLLTLTAPEQMIQIFQT